jgi:hypothetical protein
VHSPFGQPNDIVLKSITDHSLCRRACPSLIPSNRDCSLPLPPLSRIVQPESSAQPVSIELRLQPVQLHASHPPTLQTTSDRRLRQISHRPTQQSSLAIKKQKSLCLNRSLQPALCIHTDQKQTNWGQPITVYRVGVRIKATSYRQMFVQHSG